MSAWPSSSDEALLVPVHVDVLMVEREGELRSAPASGACFEEGSPLEVGAHVHWALPDGLTRGQVEGDPQRGATSTFPAVPDRWLVVRYGPLADGRRSARAWVVDALARTSTRLARWVPRPAAPGYVLTVLGPSVEGQIEQGHAESGGEEGLGASTAAAFYPATRGRFGFHDSLTDVSAGPVSYQVIGWYSRSAHDPLHEAADRDGLLARLRWAPTPSSGERAAGGPTPQAGRAAELTAAVGGIADVVEGSLQALGGSAWGVDRVVCHGLVHDVAWRGGGGSYANPAPGPHGPRLRLAGSLHEGVAEELAQPGVARGVAAHLMGLMQGPSASASGSASTLTAEARSLTRHRLYGLQAIAERMHTQGFHARRGAPRDGFSATLRWRVPGLSRLPTEALDALRQLAAVYAHKWSTPTPSWPREHLALLDALRPWLEPPHAPLRAPELRAPLASDPSGAPAPLPSSNVSWAELQAASPLVRVHDERTRPGHAGGRPGWLAELAPWWEPRELVELLNEAPLLVTVELQRARGYTQDWHRPRQTTLLLANAGRGHRHGADGRFEPDGRSLRCRRERDLIRSARTPSGRRLEGAELFELGGDAARAHHLPQVVRDLIAEAALLDPGNARLLRERVDAEAFRDAALGVHLDAIPNLGPRSAPPALAERYDGLPPSPIATNPWCQPWSPLFVEVCYSWVSSSAGDWRLGTTDWEQPASVGEGRRLSQRCERRLLSSAPVRLLASLAAPDARFTHFNAPEVSPEFASLSALRLERLDLLSAPLQGPPRPEGLQASFLRLDRVRVVDTFGTWHVLVDDARRDPGAAPLPPGPRCEPSPLAQAIEVSEILPGNLGRLHGLSAPRLPGWWRVRFEPEDGTSSVPICGYLLPDHVERALEFFDALGHGLGQLRDLDGAGQPCRWEPAEGAAEIEDPTLRALRDALLTAPPQGHISAVQAVMRAWDLTQLSVDRGAGSNAARSLLVGRPVALVRARLELQGRDASLQGVTLPSRLGALHRSDDGLLGWMEAAEGGGYALDALHVIDEAVTMRMEDDGEAHPLVRPPRLLELQAGAPRSVLLFLDPRVRTHVTTGALPQATLRLPEAWMDVAMSRLAPTLSVGPVLLDPQRKALALPALDDVDWQSAGLVGEGEALHEADGKARLAQDAAVVCAGQLRPYPDRASRARSAYDRALVARAPEVERRARAWQEAVEAHFAALRAERFPAPYDTTQDAGDVEALGESLPEGAKEHAFDGSPATRWLDTAARYPTHRSSWIEHRYAEGRRYIVGAYALRSGPDHPERDPSSWRLLGSNDGRQWTLLDQREGERFSARGELRRFSVANSYGFNRYRLAIDHVAGEADGVQLSGLSLLGLPELRVTGLSASGGRLPLLEPLQEGGLQFVDRDYRFTQVPAALRGLLLVRTANDDKGADAPGALRLHVNRRVRVFVIHDDRLPLPGWLSDFTLTEHALSAEGYPEGASVLSKDFPAGELELGGNQHGGSNYGVLLAEPRRLQEAADRQRLARLSVVLDALRAAEEAEGEAQRVSRGALAAWKARADEGLQVSREALEALTRQLERREAQRAQERADLEAALAALDAEGVTLRSASLSSSGPTGMEHAPTEHTPELRQHVEVLERAAERYANLEVELASLLRARSADRVAFSEETLQAVLEHLEPFKQAWRDAQRARLAADALVAALAEELAGPSEQTMAWLGAAQRAADSLDEEQRRREQAEGSLDEARQQIAALERDQSALSRERAALDRGLQTLSQEHAALEAEHAKALALHAREAHAWEAERRRLEGSVSTLEGELEAAKARIRALEERLEGANADVLVLNEDILDWMRRHREETETSEDLRIELGRRTSERDGARQQLRDLTASLNLRIEERDDARSRIVNLSDDLNARTVERDAARSSVNTLTTELNDRTRERDSARSERDDALRRAAGLLSQLGALAGDLSRFSLSLDESRAQSRQPLTIVSRQANTPRDLRIKGRSDSRYSWISLTRGAPQFSDRGYTISDFPAQLADARLLRTANDDKSQRHDAFLTFTLDRPSLVYVAFDRRQRLPSWLATWADTGERLSAGGFPSQASLLVLPFDAGQVTLGGNEGGQSMYNVLVIPRR